ncbi:MAG TPA: SDR family oxidoreductase [Candidatus Babeliaceae bacterium]|jgi:NAD(P)-dependent dehydrogenase (short-subunit alcohol dehydrogenase family)|nr:SDR family oxidoreductase [Candidatus Babeliaceae bacterium]
MESRKIVLVTGGSRGLGKEMAIKIAGKGMDVIITYRGNKQGAEDTIQQVEKSGGKAVALPLDMSGFSSLDSFVFEVENVLQKQWNGSRLFGLVNNAGIGGNFSFGKVTEQVFDEFLNIHFKGVYFLTQKLLPLFEDGGRIVNISTGTTRFVNPGYSVYASMKGAIEVFTKYLAKELGTRGIRANVVAPGPIETDFNSATIRNNPELKSRLSSLTPLGRVGNAEDVGGVVAFLFTDEAGWLNGQRIEVSGGINV